MAAGRSPYRDPEHPSPWRFEVDLDRGQARVGLEERENYSSGEER